MTQDEIIKIARQAGIIFGYPAYHDRIAIFAKLVAAKERVACFDAAYDAHATTAVLEAIEARGEA